MQKWANLRCIGVIRAKFEAKGKNPAVASFLRILRAADSRKPAESRAFGVGRGEHALALDVHFSEDRCPAKERNTQFALNHFAENCYEFSQAVKMENTPKTPMSNIMARCLLGEKNILPVFFGYPFGVCCGIVTKLNWRDTTI
jgi:hypothetical protein